MRKESKDFLFKLLKTPSPTGFEQPVQRLVRRQMEDYADSIETDYHGNLILGRNNKAKRRVMLAGHCDQIGLMVRHISDDGFVYFAALGGIDAGVLPGERVVIHGEKGTVEGVVGRKPIHIQTEQERKSPKIELADLWIDIGAKDKKQAEKLIEIGDCITFRLEVTELANDLIAAPGMDDKAGLFVAMETFRLLARKKLKVGLFAVSTVQEEVGWRGARTAAYSIDPEVGIAIDVTFASDNPGKNPKRIFPCKLGAGPVIMRGPNVNPVVEKRLRAIAKSRRIPYQIDPAAALLGNDANVIQVSRRGVAAGSIGIPNRYMHSQVEVCSLRDLDNAAKLLAGFVEELTEKTDLRPR